MRLTQRKTVLFSLILGLLAASSAGAQPFEIEFFERASDPNNFGQPLFLKDKDALLAVFPPGGVFDNGTAVAPCCTGNWDKHNTIIALSTDPNAITEGTQALNISMTNTLDGNQGSGNTAFDRPGILTITPADPRYAGFQAVAANPSNFSMKFDITLVASEVPDTFSIDSGSPNPFITIGFFGNSDGFVEPASIRDFTSWDATELADMEAAGHDTRNLSIPATEFNLPLAPTSYRIGFVFNGNWQLGERAGFNIDNWRFDAAFTIAELDMDFDNDVDADDFEVLMANHFDPNADTFAEGDLDGDGDNDFDDFRFFEDGWNELGAPIPFSDLLAGVPEPASVTLLLAACASLACVRRRRLVTKSILLLLVGALCFGANPSHAALSDTLLFSWETGLEGWEESGDNLFGGDPSFALGNSTIGATEGTQSFFLKQPLDGFNWGATNSIFANDNFDAIDSALDIGAEHFVLELDVTYVSPGSIPANPLGFANVSIRIESSAGTSEVGSLATYDFSSSPQTISISQPFDSWTALPAQGNETGFFRFDIGMNGDWGFSPGTFYFDNMRLRQVSEPALLTLEVDRSNGSTRILNNSGADGTGPGGLGGPVDLNYYQILSFSSADTEPDGDVDGEDFLDLQSNDPNLIPDWEADYGLQGGSLNPASWNSLDNQNVDAVDGPDPNSVAGDSTFEGWTASGGVDTALAESFFLGTSQLADTASLSLGTPFSVGDAENLQFLYREPGRPDFLREGNVVYVGVAPLSGATAVPEASTALLTLVGGAVLLMTTRSRKGDRHFFAPKTPQE